MTVYSYKARNNAGDMVTGSLSAVSQQDVSVQLKQMQYTPIKISENLAGKLNGGNILSMEIKMFTSDKVSTRDMMFFCNNLSSMTSAAIPLMGALNITSEQLTNPTLASTIRKVSQAVSEGSSFSEALAMFPKVFSEFFVNMVRAGEVSGTLDGVLKEMAVYMERQDALQQTVKGMMVYPIILLSASIGVITLIITFVMPQFVTIFVKAKVPLPAPTKFLYETGVFIKTCWMYYIPVILGIFFGLKAYFKTENGKNLWDHAILKIPVIGSLLKRSLVARFSRTLATMLNTGVPMLQSLRIVQQILGNKVFAAIVETVHSSVEKGEGIYKPLLSFPEFPKDVTYMISVGERAGNIGMMLNKIADYYENRVQMEIKELMTYIEPIFISVMGICVGGIMASTILPMFDMVKTIQR